MWRGPVVRDKVTTAFDEWRPRARPCGVCQTTVCLEPKPSKIGDGPG